MSVQEPGSKGVSIHLAKLTGLQVVQLFASIGIRNVEVPLAQRNITGDDLCYVESVEDLKELEMDLLLFQLKRLLVKIQQWKQEQVAEAVLAVAAEQYQPPVPTQITSSRPVAEVISPAEVQTSTPSAVHVEDSAQRIVHKPAAKKIPTQTRQEAKAKIDDDEDEDMDIKDVVVVAPKKTFGRVQQQRRGQQSSKLQFKQQHEDDVLLPIQPVAPQKQPTVRNTSQLRYQKYAEASLVAASKKRPQSALTPPPSEPKEPPEPSKPASVREKPVVQPPHSAPASISSARTSKPSSSSSSTAVIPSLKAKPLPLPPTSTTSNSTTGAPVTCASSQGATSVRRGGKLIDANTILQALQQMFTWAAIKVEHELQHIVVDCQRNVRIAEQLLELKAVDCLLDLLALFFPKANYSTNAYSASNIFTAMIRFVSTVACNENYSKRDLHKGVQQLRDYHTHDIYDLLTQLLQREVRQPLLVISVCNIIQSCHTQDECIRKFRKTNPYPILVQALTLHKASEDYKVVRMLGQAIAALAMDLESNLIFLELQILPILIELLQLHFQHPSVVEAVTHAIYALTYCATSHKDEYKLDAFKTDFGHLGGCKVLIQLLQQYTAHEMILSHVSRLLTNVSFVEANMKLFGKEQGCGVLINVLEANRADAALVEELCLGIINASCLSENIANFHKQSNACAVLVTVLHMHINKASLVEQACQALTNLTTLASHQVVAIEAGGCTQLIHILQQYVPLKRLTVIEQCLRAITNIANRNDGQEQFGNSDGVEMMLQLLKQPLNASITRLAAKALANFAHHPDNKRKVTLPHIHSVLHAMEKYHNQSAVIEECAILLSSVVMDVADFVPAEDRLLFADLLVVLLQRFMKQSLMVEALVLVLDYACRTFDNVLIFVDVELPKALLQVCQLYTNMQHPILLYHTIHALQNMSKLPSVLAVIATERHKGMACLLAIMKQYEDHWNIVETSSKVLNLLLCSHHVQGEDAKQGMIDSQGYSIIVAAMKRYWNKAIVFRELACIMVHILDYETSTPFAQQSQPSTDIQVSETDDTQSTWLESSKTPAVLETQRMAVQHPSDVDAAEVGLSHLSPLTIPPSTPTVTASQEEDSNLNIDLLRWHESLLQSLKFYFKHLNPHVILNLCTMLQYIYRRQHRRELQDAASMHTSSSFPSLSSLLKGANLATTSSLSRRSSSSLLSASPLEKKSHQVTFAAYNTPDMASLLLEIIQECYQMEDVLGAVCELLLTLLTCYSAEIPAWVGAIGGCSVLLEVLRLSTHDPDSTLQLLTLLQQLIAEVGNNCQLLLQSNALEVLATVLAAFDKDAAAASKNEEMKVPISEEDDLPHRQEYDDSMEELDDAEKKRREATRLQVVAMLVELKEALKRYRSTHLHVAVTLPSFHPSHTNNASTGATEAVEEAVEGAGVVPPATTTTSRKRRLKSFADSLAAPNSNSTGNNYSGNSNEVIDLVVVETSEDGAMDVDLL